MSWLVSGTEGFWRKYYEDNSPNFPKICAISGAGVYWIQMLFQAPVDAIEQNVEIDCESLLQEIGGEVQSSGDGEASFVSEAIDRVLPALTENAVEVLRRVEERLPGVPSNIFLVGRKHFRMGRTEWPRMLGHLNLYLPAPATLADFASTTPAQLAPVLDDPCDEALALAAAILHHAVRHNIEDMHVWENMPRIQVGYFSPVLRQGPPIFRGRLPSDMHELFARGLAHLLVGEREQGLEALKVAHQVGHPTARRWLEAHGAMQ